MLLILQGTLQDRPSDWSTLLFADCMLSLIDGLYARPMSWQTASDIAIIWDPGSIIPSTSSLLSTTIVIDCRACDSGDIEGDRSSSWSQTIDVSLVHIRNSNGSLLVIWYLLYESVGGYHLVQDSLRRNSLAESVTDFR
jgi:hypothetical protein